MNYSRRDRFKIRPNSDKENLLNQLGILAAQADNEVQMLADNHNRHNSGLVGWTAFSLLDGTNKRMGQATLSGGTATVSNTSVTANTRIFLSHANTGGTLGHLYISARVASTSFTITSSSATDTSTVNWLLIEPK